MATCVRMHVDVGVCMCVCVCGDRQTDKPLNQGEPWRWSYKEAVSDKPYWALPKGVPNSEPQPLPTPQKSHGVVAGVSMSVKSVKASVYEPRRRSGHRVSAHEREREGRRSVRERGSERQRVRQGGRKGRKKARYRERAGG